ncbi:hypothetical protein ALC53_01128 [Atta colombica]|uniref:Uncharacterized protein n=1 Tax=Atta colombica TaxID=520822 RepID=A0A151I626_9HYME|nr:hypothetical protein ALC53_01128 [Atta colombica]
MAKGIDPIPLAKNNPMAFALCRRHVLIRTILLPFDNLLILLSALGIQEKNRINRENGFEILTCGVDPPRVRFMHHQIAEFFIFNHVFYVLSKPWNHTQLFRNSFDSKLNYQNYRRDIPVRDISYPLEEYYDAKTVARELQQLNRDSRNMMHEYRNLCETIKKVGLFDDDYDYEYQPPYYYEVYCKNVYLMLSEDERIMKPLEQKCVYPAFQCVQKSQLLYLVRRRRQWGNESRCWEPYTKEIASGCDCMWPVTNLGEINEHY